jgi:hypothetical protein
MKIARVLLLSLCLQFTVQFAAYADEGMWLPLLLKQLNEPDMKKNGLRLSADDIYNINKSSLKDAIVHFNGGCTAEVISEKGLILTNHHCGYGQIQSHSTVENDLLTNGFWAMSADKELANPGLSATFIVRMEDVTLKVLQGVTDTMSEADRERRIASNIPAIIKDAVAGTHYEGYIRPFYYGNEYYMFITETFRDVRLVGAPPSSIGKFGGDTDNWMWPRHTGDFSIFRIYAGKDNKPAPYSKDNVPYKPKYVIPVSLKGAEQDDFTMVYGFPGRTTEYLTSFAVDMIMNESDPAKVKIRETRLAIMNADMAKNDKVRIQYSAKYASLANYWKKWAGEINGLKKLNAIETKKAFEKEFTSRLQNDSVAQKKYSKLLLEMENTYLSYRPLNKQRDYFIEAILGIEAVNYAFSFSDVIDGLSAGKKPADLEKEIAKLKGAMKGFFKDYNASTDQKVCAAMLGLVHSDIDRVQQAEIFRELEKKYKGDFSKYAAEIYSKSVFVSEEKMTKILEDIGSNYKKLKKDPIYLLMVNNYQKFADDVRTPLTALDVKVQALQRTYMKAIREVVTEKKYYPDANSTLRVAYGKVDGYSPRDGVFYNYYTTLDGIMEKENPLVDEFIVPTKLKDLYERKDYGQYADKDGELRIAFCASNHTTGGNSGSPVFNGQGHLIGTNFDRNWEGTMSDIMYDKNQVRNIVLDVRYTLFVIDKFAGAGYLLKEMNIIK